MSGGGAFLGIGIAVGVLLSVVGLLALWRRQSRKKNLPVFKRQREAPNRPGFEVKNPLAAKLAARGKGGMRGKGAPPQPPTTPLPKHAKISFAQFYAK